MPRFGTFCLARVLKAGNARAEQVAMAIENPAILTLGQAKWTILDGQSFLSTEGIAYFYGRLAKYRPEADLSVVNEAEKAEENKNEKNLLSASSPFVYIPKFAGIAFLHVPNQIERTKFFRIFPQIYQATTNEILNSIELEFINDLRQFYIKIKALDKIISIKSKVYPPNPLFGILWKPLRDYLINRNSSSLNINENGKENGINSDLHLMVEAIINEALDGLIATGFSASLTDASIIMAADGYGHGTVTGMEGEQVVPVHTSDTVHGFKMRTDAEPDVIFGTALALFKRIEQERHMEHP